MPTSLQYSITITGQQASPSPSVAPVTKNIDLAAVDAKGDSPAWAPYADVVGDTYVSVVRQSDPGANFNTLRNICLALFSPNEAALGFPLLRRLQELLRDYYQVGQPNARFPAGASPLSANEAKATESIGDFLNRWLAPLNQNIAPQLSHAQFVLLRHLLYTQEDLQLLAPWQVSGQRAW